MKFNGVLSQHEHVFWMEGILKEKKMIEIRHVVAIGYIQYCQVVVTIIILTNVTIVNRHVHPNLLTI